MKSVLISIRPKWLWEIVNGRKTIEVRKNRPKIDTPFRCLIYCTKNKDVNDLLELHKYGKIKKMNGKVVAEFLCSEIEEKPYVGLSAYCSNDFRTCLSDMELRSYANHGKPLYFWHISDLQVYDEFEDLNAYGVQYPPQSWRYVEVGN